MVRFAVCPAADVHEPGKMVKETFPATSQPNVPVPTEPVPSVTVAKIAPSPTAVGVPEMTPVEELIDIPAGRPVAL